MLCYGFCDIGCSGSERVCVGVRIVGSVVCCIGNCCGRFGLLEGVFGFVKVVS